MLESLIYNFGYVGLFVAAFLSSTIIPMSSETVVVLMTTLDYNIWLILVFATLGNYSGDLTNYCLGKYGNKFFLAKYLKPKVKKRRKLEKAYSKWGSPLLFFSWLPVIGESICIIAGAFNLNIRIFSFWVILGEAFRYMIVIGVIKFLIVS